MTGERNGLSFKHAKSQLGGTQMTLLGMVVGREGISPDLKRIAALKDYPPPRSKAGLREFLGVIGWLRPFLGPRLAHEAHGLRTGLKKEAPEEFAQLTPKQAASFEKLKRLAAEYMALSVPDYQAADDPTSGRPFEIYLDASGYGIGAVLCQVDPEL